MFLDKECHINCYLLILQKLFLYHSHIQTGNSFRSFRFSEIKNFEDRPASGSIDDLLNYKAKRIVESDQQETIPELIEL